MRHDEERPQTTQLNTSAPVPGYWIQVLATMRANTFTRLSIDDIRGEAAHIIIASPSPEATRASFAQLLDGLSAAHGAPTSDAEASAVTNSPAVDDFVEITTPEAVVPADVPAGTWVFLPHQQDGWVELEAASARVRAALVAENTVRDREEKFTLIEYGVNLWLWAEPPYGGGDPVCHAGELISWESAWALSVPATSAQQPGSAAARPPIFFGLPPVLQKRRLGE